MLEGGPEGDKMCCQRVRNSPSLMMHEQPRMDWWNATRRRRSNAPHRIKDLNTHCLGEFRKHWQCLEQGNQQLWQCRPDEWKLNKCVYEKLVSGSELAWDLSTSRSLECLSWASRCSR